MTRQKSVYSFVDAMSAATRSTCANPSAGKYSASAEQTISTLLEGAAIMASMAPMQPRTLSTRRKAASLSSGAASFLRFEEWQESWLIVLTQATLDHGIERHKPIFSSLAHISETICSCLPYPRSGEHVLDDWPPMRDMHRQQEHHFWSLSPELLGQPQESPLLAVLRTYTLRRVFSFTKTFTRVAGRAQNSKNRKCLSVTLELFKCSQEVQNC